MKTFPLLIVLFIVASGLVDVVVGLLVKDPGVLSPIFFLWIALMFGQAGLLAAWLAMGRSHILVRLLTTVAVGGILPLVMNGFTIEDFSEICSISLVHVFFVAGALSLPRFAGMRLELAGLPSDRATYKTLARPWQFSLGKLFSWTTSVAIVLGILRLLNIEEHIEVSVKYFLLQGMIAFVVLAPLWTVFSTWNIFLRVVAMLVVCAAEVFFLNWFDNPSAWNLTPIYIMFTSTQAAYIAAGAAVFRLSGYRVVWAKKSAA